jgi:hypothetical protein
MSSRHCRLAQPVRKERSELNRWGARAYGLTYREGSGWGWCGAFDHKAPAVYVRRAYLTQSNTCLWPGIVPHTGVTS